MRDSKTRILAAAALTFAVASTPIPASASFSKKPLIEYPQSLRPQTSHLEKLAELRKAKRNFERALIGFKRDIGDLVIKALRRSDRKNFVEFLDRMMRKDNDTANRQTIELDMGSLRSIGRSFTSEDIEYITVGIAITNIGRFRSIAKTVGGADFVSLAFLELSATAPGKRDFLSEFKAWVLSDERTESLYIRLAKTR